MNWRTRTPWSAAPHYVVLVILLSLAMLRKRTVVAEGQWDASVNGPDGDRYQNQGDRTMVEKSRNPDQSESRTVVVDSVSKQRDCGFNLLARIVAVNSCDRCPVTKARIVMAANYLHGFANSEASTKRDGTRYNVAREYLLQQCVASESQTKTVDAAAETENPDVGVLELLESIPQRTWEILSEVNEGMVSDESLAQASVVQLLFPEIEDKCCGDPAGCSHNDIANYCI
eukprot:scpid90905/ scgid33595/ 